MLTRIFTSRYTKKFHKSLPTKMILGICTLKTEGINESQTFSA